MREAASFIAHQSSSDESSVVERVVAGFWRTAHVLNNRRKVMSLTDFDDHMLRDLGLTRGDIEQALDVPFTHDPSLELQRLALRNRRSRWGA